MSVKKLFRKIVFSRRFGFDSEKRSPNKEVLGDGFQKTNCVYDVFTNFNDRVDTCHPFRRMYRRPSKTYQNPKEPKNNNGSCQKFCDNFFAFRFFFRITKLEKVSRYPTFLHNPFFLQSSFLRCILRNKKHFYYFFSTVRQNRPTKLPCAIVKFLPRIFEHPRA